MQRTALVALLMSGLGFMGIPTVAHAQSGSQSGSSARPGAGGSGAIEEIVVMARKREESIQETPVSVTAFTQDMLQVQGISDLEDIGEATPNLLFQQNTNSYSPRVYIRGVGSDDQILTIDPGVGVYVDGVYLARTFALNLNVMDIERVEVLRGPQGTLYGRNTIGGAINLTSSKPSGEWGSVVKANVGTQGKLDTGFSVDFPILSEVLAGRISLATEYDKGFFENKFGSDSDWSNDRGLAGRAVFMFTPGDSSSYELIYDRSQKRSHPSGVNLNSVCEPDSATTLCTGGFNTAVLAPAADGSKFSTSLNLGANNVYYGEGALADRSDNNIDSTGLSLISTFDLSDDTQLKLTTAGRTLETRDALDIDGTTIAFTELFQHNWNKQGSQEFQLGTKLFDGRMDWISGLYLFYEDTKFEVATYNLAQDSAVVQGLLGAACPIGTSPLGNAISCASAGLSSDARTDQTTLSYAGYTHMEFDLTDRLQFEAGLRYTYDHKRFKTRVTLKTTTVQTNRRDTEHWDDWSPMAGLNYQLTDDVLLYAKWSRGFRGGQFNGRANDTNPLTTASVDPETVKVSEVGMKSSWMDNRVIFNLAAFRNNYTDQQLTSFTFDGTRFVSIVQNAGKSRLIGAEADLMVRPTNDLNLFGSIGVLNAKYLTFREPVLFPVATIRDASNRDFKNTPELTFNVGADYTFPMPLVGGWLRTRMDYSHTSQVYFDTGNRESIRQDKVGLLNGRIAWVNQADTVEVALWGRNLTNRRYDAFGLDLNSSLGYTTSYPAPPFQGGLELTLRY